MRTIDADAALKALRKCQTYLYDARDPKLKIELSSAEAAINNLPTIQPVATDTNVGDTISRQWLMECVNEGWIKFDTEKDENRFIHLVRDMAPPVQPEPKEGHWIEGGIYREVIECNCSECGQLMTTAATVRMNYCPNCGAYMKGERQK